MKLKRTFIGCFGMLLLPIIPFIVVTKLNSWRLNQLEADFSTLSHPSSSELVARYKAISTFGNANRVDFVVTELRAKTREGQIAEFYKGKTVWGPSRADEDYQQIKNGRQPVDINFLPSPLPANYHVDMGHKGDWNLNFAAGRKGLYLVQIINYGDNWDLVSMFDLN
jgi:hypothetical protein